MTLGTSVLEPHPLYDHLEEVLALYQPKVLGRASERFWGMGALAREVMEWWAILVMGSSKFPNIFP